MRRTKTLRQGHTLYLARYYWDAENKFYYSKVFQCTVTKLIVVDSIKYATYESNEELFTGLPVQFGVVLANNPKPLFFTRNSATLWATHRTMILNWQESCLTSIKDY